MEDQTLLVIVRLVNCQPSILQPLQQLTFFSLKIIWLDMLQLRIPQLLHQLLRLILLLEMVNTNYKTLSFSMHVYILIMLIKFYINNLLIETTTGDANSENWNGSSPFSFGSYHSGKKPKGFDERAIDPTFFSDPTMIKPNGPNTASPMNYYGQAPVGYDRNGMQHHGTG